MKFIYINFIFCMIFFSGIIEAVASDPSVINRIGYGIDSLSFADDGTMYVDFLKWNKDEEVKGKVNFYRKYNRQRYDVVVLTDEGNVKSIINGSRVQPTVINFKDKKLSGATRCIGSGVDYCITVTPEYCNKLRKSSGAKNFRELKYKMSSCAKLSIDSRWAATTDDVFLNLRVTEQKNIEEIRKLSGFSTKDAKEEKLPGSSFRNGVQNLTTDEMGKKLEKHATEGMSYLNSVANLCYKIWPSGTSSVAPKNFKLKIKSPSKGSM